MVPNFAILQSHFVVSALRIQMQMLIIQSHNHLKFAYLSVCKFVYSDMWAIKFAFYFTMIWTSFKSQWHNNGTIMTLRNNNKKHICTNKMRNIQTKANYVPKSTFTCNLQISFNICPSATTLQCTPSLLSAVCLERN